MVTASVFVSGDRCADKVLRMNAQRAQQALLIFQILFTPSGMMVSGWWLNFFCRILQAQQGLWKNLDFEPYQ